MPGRTIRNKILLAGAAVLLAVVVAGIVVAVVGVFSPRRATDAATSPTVTVTSTPATSSTAPTSSSPPTASLAVATAPSSAAASSVTVRSGPRGEVPKLPARQQTDPLAVAKTAVQTLNSYDTDVDDDSTSAAQRAAYLLDPTLAAKLTRPATTGPGVQWQAWADSHAYTSVTTVRIDIPWLVADSQVSAVRAIGYVITVHPIAGVPQTLPQRTLAVTMTRPSVDTPWRVSTLEVP